MTSDFGPSCTTPHCANLGFLNLEDGVMVCSICFRESQIACFLSNSIIADDSCPAVTTAGGFASAPGSNTPAVVVPFEAAHRAPDQYPAPAKTGMFCAVANAGGDHEEVSASSTGLEFLEIDSVTGTSPGECGTELECFGASQFRSGACEGNGSNAVGSKTTDDSARTSSCGVDSSHDLTSSEIDDGPTFGGSHTAAATRSPCAGIASGPQDLNTPEASGTARKAPSGPLFGGSSRNDSSRLVSDSGDGLGIHEPRSNRQGRADDSAMCPAVTGSLSDPTTTSPSDTVAAGVSREPASAAAFSFCGDISKYAATFRTMAPSASVSNSTSSVGA